MTAEEKNIIKTLVENLKHVEGEAVKLDKKAEKVIKDGVSQVVGAEYYMAQTIVAQQELIRRLQDRLEKHGDDSTKVGFASIVEEEEGEEPKGFLKTAAETASTVTGGAVLTNAIATVSDELGYEENLEEEDDFPVGLEDDLDDFTGGYSGDDQDF